MLVARLVDVVGALGYPGVISLMFLESSFFPFPSEVVIPPAGYLASRGDMNIVLVWVCGTAGSLLGALFNYYIAMKWGRRLFERYGKYLFISPDALDRAEAFFERHGHISMFTARLLPVIRQYVSLPAGAARMNLFKFCLYTGLGSGIWVAILSAVGWFFGSGEEETHGAMSKISIILVLFCVALVAAYVARVKMNKNRGG
ncbi:MAG: DedA family protein [Synergistaceae bacterium]|nr:DedA family protein [Synergistaceae bacterium]